jgi:hypothetical protein
MYKLFKLFSSYLFSYLSTYYIYETYLLHKIGYQGETHILTNSFEVHP